jgi:hypothetical protein
MDEPGFFAALAEFDDAVMAEAQPLGYIRYRRLFGVGCSGDVEQELVLLGMEAGVGGAAFAEVEKLAEGVAELGQVLESLAVVGVAMGVAIEGLGGSPHGDIVSHYDILIRLATGFRQCLMRDDAFGGEGEPGPLR